MSLDNSDPLDLAFPAVSSPAASSGSSDPLDLAFPAEAAAPGGKKPSSLWQKYLGFQESQLAGATGGMGSLAGGLSYLGRRLEGGSEEEAQKERSDVQNALTYRPRTAEGQSQSEAMGRAGQWLGPKEGQFLGSHAADLATRAGASPEVAGVAGATGEVLGNVAPQAAVGGALSGLGRLRPGTAPPSQSGPAPTAEEVINQSRSNQSIGAAADGGSTASLLTPETRAEIVRAGQQGLPINQTALDRHAVAESLPVPQRLTRGMATGDGPLLSEEINSRRTNPEIGEHLDNLNQGLIQNIDTLRREAAPTVVGNNVIDNSQSLIDSFKTVADKRDEAITAAYDNAKKIGGNKLPMDGQSFVDDVQGKLEDPKIREFLPGEVKRSVIDPIIKKGPENMTLDDFLSSQKIIGRAQRAAQRTGDGNVLHALNEVRDSLENTNVAPGVGEQAKAAYREASTLAKANFDDLKVNPAYKAAYEDRSTTPTGEESDLNRVFAQKYVLGGSRANLQRMRTMFGDDQTAHETMTAIALNHLRESAGIKPGFDEGNFSQNGYNSAWATKIEPRAAELLRDPKLIEQAQNLGKVAAWEQARSKSSYVNASNTSTSERPLSAAANAGMGMATDAATELLPGPGRAAVKLGKSYMKARNAAKAAAQAELDRLDFVNETVKPGAGITHQPASVPHIGGAP